MEILHAKHVTNLGSVKRLPLDIGFATTCLGRGFQLAPQLVINMALAAPYRQDMIFYVVLFRGATEDNLRFLAHLVFWFLIFCFFSSCYLLLFANSLELLWRFLELPL